MLLQGLALQGAIARTQDQVCLFFFNAFFTVLVLTDIDKYT